MTQNKRKLSHFIMYQLGAKYINSKSLEEIDEFLEESVSGSCEGLIFKTLIDNSPYQPSKRSFNWLKSIYLKYIHLHLFPSSI